MAPQDVENPHMVMAYSLAFLNVPSGFNFVSRMWAKRISRIRELCLYSKVIYVKSRCFDCQVFDYNVIAARHNWGMGPLNMPLNK